MDIYIYIYIILPHHLHVPFSPYRSLGDRHPLQRLVLQGEATSGKNLEKLLQKRNQSERKMEPKKESFSYEHNDIDNNGIIF